jgi:two-component system chemotaxis response regulator CheY
MVKHVLLVEDDGDTRETVREVLVGEGYRVTAAADGRKALALLPSLPELSLMMVDLIMPLMDGAEFIEAARRLPAHAHTPVLVLSADFEAEVHSPAGVRVLHKPITIDTLLAVVGSLCSAPPEQPAFG